MKTRFLRTCSTFKCVLPTALAVTALLAPTVVRAQVTQITSAQLDALNPTNVPITGTEGTPYTTYTSVTGTQTLTFTNPGTPPGGQRLERRDQQPTGIFGGDFPDGTPLLVNLASPLGPGGTGSNNGLNIAFANPISAFGFNVDSNNGFVYTDFTLVVSEGATQTSVTLSNSFNTASNDTSVLPFFGVQDTRGNFITSVLLYGNPAANPPGGGNPNSQPNDFGVGLLRFYVSPLAPPPSVPEPSNVALLMGMASSGFGFLARRRRANINS